MRPDQPVVIKFSALGVVKLETILSSSYPNLVGSVTLAVASIFLFIACFAKYKKRSIRLSSILLVVSLSLFSSHVLTYFAAIFIVATAVTELEFLQNLAAIVRKNESYFSFKKEALSKADSLKRKEEEVMEEECADEAQVHNGLVTGNDIRLSHLQDLPRAALVRLSFRVEEKALDYLSKEYGPIERSVRFRKNGEAVVFDGVVESSGDGEMTVLNVRWSHDSDKLFLVTSLSSIHAEEAMGKCEKIAGRKPNCVLVVVANKKADLNDDRMAKLLDDSNAKQCEIRCLTLNEIGFNLVG